MGKGYDPWSMKGGYDPWSMKGGWDPWSMKGGWEKGGCKGKDKDAGKAPGKGGGGSSSGGGGGDTGSPKAPPPNKIFVGALPQNPNEEAMREHFEQFGEIIEIKIMHHDNGIPKGFAFVTFKHEDSAKAVFENYDNNVIDGKWVDCKSAEKSEAGSSPKPGDWWCPQCGEMVFASKTSCRMCGFEAKGKGGKGFCKGGKGGKGGKDGGKGTGKTQRIGDWNCPNCGDLVFASRDACRCGTPKPDDARLTPY